MRLWSIHPKYSDRAPHKAEELVRIVEIEAHPLFNIIDGELEELERNN